MAVNKNLTASSLQLEVEKGIDAKGNPILGKITYTNIKAAATEQDMYDVALVIGGLQQFTLSGVRCIDYNDLVEGM